LKKSSPLFALAFVALLIAAWQWAASRQAVAIIPGPWAVVKGIGEPAQRGLLVKYVVASLFRVHL
jgi:NitT/TauT family transport system permease protein